MQNQYNTRSPAVKRLFREAQELKENPDEDIHAEPLEDNLFEWHFTVRGPPDTAFENGLYHGRIIMPTEYPMKPPNIMFLTPNGRFECNTKICLSISGYHPETWQPSWSIRTALRALIGFMPTPGAGAIGALDVPADKRKELAQKSHNWTCPSCLKLNRDFLPAVPSSPSPVGVQGDTVITDENRPGSPKTTQSPAADTSSQPALESPGTVAGNPSFARGDTALPGSFFSSHAGVEQNPFQEFRPQTASSLPEPTSGLSTHQPTSVTNKENAAETSSPTRPSNSTDEMKAKQAALLKERQRVLQDRLAAMEGSSAAPPVQDTVQSPHINVGRSQSVADLDRMERMLQNLKHVVVIICILIFLMLMRRFAVFELDGDEDDLFGMEL